MKQFETNEIKQITKKRKTSQTIETTNATGKT